MAARGRCILPAAAAASASGHHHLPVRRRLLRLRLHHRRLHAAPFGVDADRHSRPRPMTALLAAFGRKISADLGRSREAAVDEMMADGHARGEDPHRALPDDALHRPARGRRGAARICAASAPAADMRATSSPTSRRSTPRSITACRAMVPSAFSIMELGMTATADKVKPVLERRRARPADPAAAHKGTREAYIGGALAPGRSLRNGPAAARPRGEGSGHRRASGDHARRPSRTTGLSSTSGPFSTTGTGERRSAMETMPLRARPPPRVRTS